VGLAVEVTGEELVVRRGERERERELGLNAGRSSPGRHRVEEGSSGRASGREDERQIRSLPF
jgi:hypothetical protein